MAELSEAIPPRLALRALLGGTLVALALFWVLMVAAAALGVWRLGVMDADALVRGGLGLGLWAGLAWPLAVLAGAYTTSRLTSAAAPGDGALRGLVTWASTCVTAGVLGCAWFMWALTLGLTDLDVLTVLDSAAVMGGVLASEIFAMMASVVGGRAGSPAFGPSEPLPGAFREPTRTAP